MTSDDGLKILWLISYLCYVSCELNLSDGSPCVSDGVNGTCVSVFRCQSAAYIYHYRNAGFTGTNIPEFNDICSYKDGNIIVCCTDCTIYDDEKYKNYYIDVDGMILEKNGKKSYDKCMDYLQELPFPCRGLRRKTKKPVLPSFRIDKHLEETKQCHSITEVHAIGIGGRIAKRHEKPSMALLGYGTELQKAQWICGGSIISERFILTAAHCIYSRMYGYVNFAALGILKRNDPPKYWKVYKIKRYIRHPDYLPPSKYHDIALLETENEINFGRNILPACLDTFPADAENDIRRFGEAPGWGQMGQGNRFADVLQVMELTSYDKTNCSLNFPIQDKKLERGYDDTIQMCFGAYENIVDTCQGDSGGPLQMKAVHCIYVVMGVTAFGNRYCGIEGVPGIFTRVSHYVPWIESIVWPD